LILTRKRRGSARVKILLARRIAIMKSLCPRMRRILIVWLAGLTLGVNGRNGYYIRKKPTAKCHLPSSVPNFVVVKPCPCTDLDYECDAGYYQPRDSLVCEPIKNFDFTQLVPTECVGTYNKSNGYRKISTTMCQGGVVHLPIEEKCPGKWSFLSSLMHFLTRVTSN